MKNLQTRQATKAMGSQPPVSDDTLSGSRAQFLGLMAAFAEMRQESPGMKSVETRDIQIDENLRARIYIPPRSPEGSTPPNEGLPVGLYIHAGGWFTGSVDGEDFMCRDIAFNSQIILISPEYRLAPENPYPAGLEDCFRAYEYIHSHAVELGGSPRQKFIMGASSGGNLTACVALKYTSDPELRASGIMVSCMMSCDPSALPAEYKEKYYPNVYLDTPIINTDSKRLARRTLETLFALKFGTNDTEADLWFYRMATASCP